MKKFTKTTTATLKDDERIIGEGAEKKMRNNRKEEKFVEIFAEDC